MAGKITLPGLPELYTTKEIADWLGISRERVYTLCSQRGFPCIKLSPRRIRFSKDNVLEWVRERGFCVSDGEI